MVARLALPGRHVAQNALCVAAAALLLGVPAADVVRGLEAFRGVGRRLELKGEPHGVVVLDDYAHHPTAIAATLAAVRQAYPGRRVWAVYEPLTYHRTAALLDRFAGVLASGADEVVIADIWAGRDPDTTIVSAEGLASAIRERGLPGAAAPGDVVATADYLAARVVPGDVVLVMGGGHSYRIAERLVELLTSTISW
jgi:UDP-N-acetylmuramate--alanine ligase